MNTGSTPYGSTSLLSTTGHVSPLSPRSARASPNFPLHGSLPDRVWYRRTPPTMTFLEDTYRFRTDVSRGTGGVAPGGGGTATVSIANGASYCKQNTPSI